LLFLLEKTDVAAHHLQRRAERLRLRQQRSRRSRIAADRRHAGAKNPRLLEADGFAIRAEKFAVIDIHGGDDGARWRVNVGGIQSSAQTDFENHHVERGDGENFPGGQRAEFEIGQRHIATRGGDPRKTGDQSRIIHRRAVNPHPFVVTQQMRRGVQTDAIPGAAQNALQHGADRALAIGAGDQNDRTGFALTEPRLDFGDPRQP